MISLSLGWAIRSGSWGWNGLQRKERQPKGVYWGKKRMHAEYDG